MFPYEQVALDRAVILFDLVKDRVDPIEDHRELPLPDPPVRSIVIALDGIGSSSAGLAIANIIDWISLDTDFEVCVFSYQGFGTRHYDRRDTVRTDFDDLVQALDRYIEYYADADCIVLLGYSFGGLIVSEWLYRNRMAIFTSEPVTTDEESHSNPGTSSVRGSCLVASPIRLSTTRVYIRHSYKRAAGGQRSVSAIVEGYTAIPEEIPGIAPLMHFIAEDDGLLDASAYTFADRPLADRPAEVVVESLSDDPPTNHQNIVDAPKLRDHLAPALAGLCNAIDVPEQFV